MKKIICKLMCLVILLNFLGTINIIKNKPIQKINAEIVNENLGETTYKIYDEEGNLLIETQSVEVGDIFINRDFRKYEVTLVDETLGVANSKYIGTIDKPKVTNKKNALISNAEYSKNIGFYCSHNDESYENGDSTSSVYGKGGIHDIVQLICENLQKYGVNTVFDETLHIPHDSKAYTRSSVTAKGLLRDYKLDALFDIHRDGASRKLYITNDKGTERAMVRIIVGQTNPYKDKNLEFALYLMSVSEVVCPWLFLDIYYAKGHYNQALTNKSLLFEMGSHLVEKDLVKKTVPYLAEVIAKALYYTQINEKGELIIGNNESNNSSLNDYFEENTDTVIDISSTVTKDNNIGSDTIQDSTINKGQIGGIEGIDKVENVEDNKKISNTNVMMNIVSVIAILSLFAGVILYVIKVI